LPQVEHIELKFHSSKCYCWWYFCCL